MIDAAIGRTPLVRLEKVIEPEMAELWVKVEGMNPGGSIKDRTALSMITDAEQRGVLKPGGTIVEPTSGNTGIGLAQVAATRGYKLILCLPSQMSEERKRTLIAYGAQLARGRSCGSRWAGASMRSFTARARAARSAAWADSSRSAHRRRR